MNIPEDIIVGWPHFVEHCCLGTPPLEPANDAQRAFNALRRLWPARITQLNASDRAGLIYIAPAIKQGIVLADCEPLQNFGPVLDRLRKGEVSSLAELTVAAGLRRQGLATELEPPLGSNVLDCAVTIGPQRVYIEVVAPETSFEMQTAMEMLEALTRETIEKGPAGCHTELLLHIDPENQQTMIVNALSCILADCAIHELNGIGTVRRSTIAVGSTPDVSPTINNPDPRPIIAVGSVRTTNGVATSAAVRMPMTDERAHRVLSAELRHFSRDEANMLILCVTRVPGGFGMWLPLVERWFQPTRNTRVGAVALYEEGLLGTPLALRQRWRIAVNPFARIPVPQALLDAFLSQSEDSAWPNRAAR